MINFYQVTVLGEVAPFSWSAPLGFCVWEKKKHFVFSQTLTSASGCNRFNSHDGWRVALSNRGGANHWPLAASLPQWKGEWFHCFSPFWSFSQSSPSWRFPESIDRTAVRGVDGSTVGYCCCSMSHLNLLLLHFGQQEFGIDVALLKEMLQPLVAHVIRVSLPRLASLLRCDTHKVFENTLTQDLKWSHFINQRLTGW